MSSVQQLRRLVAAFDHGGARVQHAFAYGSAVFKQASGSSSSSSTTTTTTKDSPQVDLVLAVGDSDIRSWHAANLSHPRHRLHYSGTARHILGPGGIAFLQDRSGGGRVYYNPFAQIDEDGPRVKYGVTSVSALAADLREWQSMYLAGRMHKPVLTLRSEADSADSTDSVDSASSIDSAQQANLQCALATALLGLPASFTERELYIAIAGLSYLGDFRMLVGGESPSKVADIVDGPGQLERFREFSLLKQQLQPSSVTNNVDGQADSKVVLVSTTHLLRHYMHVSRKLGVNLAIAKSRGKFMFVDAFTQLSPLSSLRSKFVQLSTSSSTDPTLPNAYIQSYEAFAKEQLDQTNTEDGHMRYVKHIYEQISSLAGTGSATIVLQDLSTLLDAGIPLHALNALVSALRSFAYRTESRLVLLAHADSDVMQDVSLPFDYAQYNPDSSLGSTHSSLVRTLLSVSHHFPAASREMSLARFN
ncbi:Mmp37-domain-containing protein [Ramicandelaber brevisporus]|nr:Mmp37-domain-containing protein [Ramicandelaber brevisporus]